MKILCDYAITITHCNQFFRTLLLFDVISRKSTMMRINPAAISRAQDFIVVSIQNKPARNVYCFNYEI
jgi:hypothetical protein